MPVELIWKLISSGLPLPLDYSQTRTLDVRDASTASDSDNRERYLSPTITDKRKHKSHRHASSSLEESVLPSHCEKCNVMCIYTQRNISIYYRTQSAIKPIRLHRYSPNSQVIDIPLTGR